MTVDRRNFLVFGSAGLVALGMTKAAAAELPALLRGRTISSSPAKAVFARAFNLWMDQAVRHEQEWSHEMRRRCPFPQTIKLGYQAHARELAPQRTSRIYGLGQHFHSSDSCHKAPMGPQSRRLKRFLAALLTCGCMKPSAIPRAGRMRRVMSRISKAVSHGH